MGIALVLPTQPGLAYVALMAGQSARPLNGTFNGVPVLHSNQPEEVEGPGILLSTTPGISYAAEGGIPLLNADFTFSGEFGIHLHHKYIPPRENRWDGDRRRELTLGLILINSSYQPVHIRFESGAVRNSFQAPYLANYMLGVIPLGVRAWNTGPGDATATQMLRHKLDPNLIDEITIPGQTRVVLFKTQLPALGIANALLKGHSDGPFQMAVVAAENPNNDYDIVAILDQGRLAPGRIYLNRINEIKKRQVFSRVSGVALGDFFQASIDHDLFIQGPLHVPLTSTHRNDFGTREAQVNPLASRMIDSSIDNVGTYGVRYEVTLNLKGTGPYELVLSHPVAYGRSKSFIAFRGSLQIQSEEGLDDLHVGMRSGESLLLKTLNLKPGINNQVKITMVYPADSTPGHLLSVVPASQLALLRDQERQQALARSTPIKMQKIPDFPPDLAAPLAGEPEPLFLHPSSPNDGPAVPPPLTDLDPKSGGTGRYPSTTLLDHYQQALEAQQQLLRGQLGR